VNYKETFLVDELNRILTDQQTAEYLDGIFSVIRSIVGYTSIVNDMVFSEMMKDKVDKKVLITVFNEADEKLTGLLNTITEAHQLVSKTHITDLADKTITGLSDELSLISDKVTELLQDMFTIKSDIEPFILTYASKTDLEILVSGMVYKVINYEIPPGTIKISLKKNEDGKRAAITVTGESDGNLPEIPPETEIDKLMHTDTMSRIFVRRFCESVAGIGSTAETDKGLSLSIEMDIIPDWDMTKNLRLSSGCSFNFENKRFSPTTMKLGRYSKQKTYGDLIPNDENK
jgi:uncharacterized protein (UPF0218 family)